MISIVSGSTEKFIHGLHYLFFREPIHFVHLRPYDIFNKYSSVIKWTRLSLNGDKFLHEYCSEKIFIAPASFLIRPNFFKCLKFEKGVKYKIICREVTAFLYQSLGAFGYEANEKEINKCPIVDNDQYFLSYKSDWINQSWNQEKILDETDIVILTPSLPNLILPHTKVHFVDGNNGH